MKSKNYQDIQISKEPAIYTGNKVFDEFFSSNGGMIIGTTILLTGSSGGGKTTFAVNLQKTLNNFRTSLYSREMRASAVKSQTANLNINSNNAKIADVETCPTFNEYMVEINDIKPKILIIDSLHVIATEDFPEMSQESAIDHIIKTIRDWTYNNNAISFIIGHVTKDDEFRGANTIMQMVDAHLEMICHKNGSRTIGWGHKNRKGPIKSLFYVLKEKGIEFYTTEQWGIKNSDKKLGDFIAEAIKTYLDAINNHPNYKNLRKELKSELDKLMMSTNDVFEFSIAYANLCKRLINKYEIK